MAETTQIILDPTGNGDRDGRRWIAAQRYCLRELAPAEVTLVESVAEAALAAKDSALKGIRKIVSVGDTATAHGVVNGVMQLAEGHRRHLKVGFLSVTRPDPWSRTLGLPRGLVRQLEVLNAGHTLPYDVCRMDRPRTEHSESTRYFLNSASFGMPGQLRQRWREGTTGLLRALARLAGANEGDATQRRPRVRLEGLDGVLYEGDCALAMLMGGRFDASFGHVAPHADPTDGRLEVAWLDGGPWWAVAFQLAGVWLGGQRAAGADLRWQSVEQLRAVALDGPVYLELDGQPAGRLPATFSVEPRALPVIVAPVAVNLRKPVFKTADRLRSGRLVGNIKSAAGL